MMTGMVRMTGESGKWRAPPVGACSPSLWQNLRGSNAIIVLELRHFVGCPRMYADDMPHQRSKRGGKKKKAAAGGKVVYAPNGELLVRRGQAGQ